MLKRFKREIKEGKTFLQFSFLKAFGNCLAMILPLVVAKLFSEELFASYCLAKMVVFFFSVLIMASLRTPFVVFANQERTQTDKINKTFSVQCLLLLISLTSGCVAAVVFARPLAAFAKIPVRSPREAGQLSRLIPIGAKIGVMRRLMALSIDLSEFSLPKLPSVPTALNRLSATTTIRMTRPARIRNPFNLCQVWCITPWTVGMW